MSIIRSVIRMCAVAALMDRTWAEDRCLDSDNTPLAEALTEDPKPYIVVYTDEDLRTDVRGIEIYGSNRSLALVLELGVASAMTKEEGGKQIVIPDTDEGFEFAVDVVESQALVALLGDPHNVWAELLRRIILKTSRVMSRRAGSSERERRWAARQIAFTCDVISDWPPDTVIGDGHPIRDFIELAKSGSPPTYMATAAEMIEAVLNQSPAPDWRQVQSWLTLTKFGMRGGVGIAPFLSTDEEAPTLEELTPEQDEMPEQSPIQDDDPYD